MDTNQQATTQKVGRVVVFLGVETYSWQLQQFRDAARFVRSLGVDSLAVKCADGSGMWYGRIGGPAAVRSAILAEGCGCIPYMYGYGDKFGALQGEINVLKQLMAIGDGCVCLDVEAEYNGQVAWAERVCEAMRPVPGLLYVTSWADPDYQDWDGVTRALAACVNAWVPQQYTLWLAGQESELQRLGETNIEPAIMLTGDFGPNDPLGIARTAHQHGHTTAWLWEYANIAGNPGLVRNIVAALGGAAPEPAPTPAPTPAPGGGEAYTIRPGDTLWGIAAHLLGNGDRWPEIYHYADNAQIIGPNPDVIHIGRTIHIPPR